MYKLFFLHNNVFFCLPSIKIKFEFKICLNAFLINNKYIIIKLFYINGLVVFYKRTMCVMLGWSITHPEELPNIMTLKTRENTSLQYGRQVGRKTNATHTACQ